MIVTICLEQLRIVHVAIGERNGQPHVRFAIDQFGVGLCDRLQVCNAEGGRSIVDGVGGVCVRIVELLFDILKTDG